MGFRSSFGSSFGTLAGLGLGSVFVYHLPAAVRLIKRWIRETRERAAAEAAARRTPSG